MVETLNKLKEELNSLLQIGYPDLKELKMEIKDSKIFNEDINLYLEKVTKNYNQKRKNFIDSIKYGYKNYLFLRLFYGKQFIQLYEFIKNKNGNILHLINSVILYSIRNINIDYQYDEKISILENINSFLEKNFWHININSNEIYNRNQILPDIDLNPVIYLKVKNSFSYDYIINIYLNITGKIPIPHTILICNENTSIEQIRAFFYRVFLCETRTLFLILNLEYLNFSSSNYFIKKLKKFYNLKKGQINSCLLVLYEKVDFIFTRDLEELITEEHILNNSYLIKPENKINEFLNIEVYSSLSNGYGKTTEIKYYIKRNRGFYYYLPIGGKINKDAIINNLFKLNIQEGKNSYLHLDLKDTEDDRLMNEVLFKILIMRYLDSYEKIYYLGYDINIIIEIPNGFYDFKEKHKILNLFNSVYIDKLKPLRLENNIKYVKESNISIVAEVLTLYDKGKIGKENINLDAKISKSAEDCEKIINKYFKIENPNYYKKMNFIKILASQFTKFTKNILLDCSNYSDEETISKARLIIIKNFIYLAKLFSNSGIDEALMKQRNEMTILAHYDELIYQANILLLNEYRQEQIFFF